MEGIQVKGNKLYTAVVEYEKGSTRLTAIGMIHVAPPGYYEDAQRGIYMLRQGFFEGVQPPLALRAVPEDRLRFLQVIGQVSELIQRFTSAAGFVSQRDSLVFPPGWNCADITLDEFLTDAPMNVLEDMAKAVTAFERLEGEYKGRRSELAALWQSLIVAKFHPEYRNSKIFPDDTLMNGFLLDTRNKRLFQALEPTLQESGLFGLVYGAGHLEGIDTYVQEKGFVPQRTFWVPFLDVNVEVLRRHMADLESLFKNG